MKKKTFRMAVTAVVVAAAGYGVYLNQAKANTISEIELANVEALAFTEYNPNAWYGAKLVMCKDRHGSCIGEKCQEVQDRTSKCNYSSTWGRCD